MKNSSDILFSDSFFAFPNEKIIIEIDCIDYSDIHLSISPAVGFKSFVDSFCSRCNYEFSHNPHERHVYVNLKKEV